MYVLFVHAYMCVCVCVRDRTHAKENIRMLSSRRNYSIPWKKLSTFTIETLEIRVYFDQYLEMLKF